MLCIRLEMFVPCKLCGRAERQAASYERVPVPTPCRLKSICEAAG